MDQLRKEKQKDCTLETSVRYSGIVKLLWRKLSIPVPRSEIIIGGVELLKD
jgi:hypothetical protein